MLADLSAANSCPGTGESYGAEKAATTFSKAFAVLADRKTRDGLAKANIDPVALILQEFSASALAAIANAYRYQMPRVRGERPTQH